MAGRNMRAMLTSPTSSSHSAMLVAPFVGIRTASAIRTITKKLVSVTRAKARTSECDTTTRMCSDSPTNSSPTRVAEAAPAVR